MFRNLFNSIQSVVAIFDNNGMLLECNPATYKSFNINKEEDKEISLVSLGIVKDKNELESVYKKVLKGKYVKSLFKIKLSNQAHIDLIIDINKIENEGKQAMLVVGHDVTEKMQAKLDLEKSEEKFRYITEKSIDIIWQVDDNMKFTYLSPSLSRILGYEPEQWIGKTINQFMGTRNFAKLYKEVQLSLKKPTENPLIHIETRIKT